MTIYEPGMSLQKVWGEIWKRGCGCAIFAKKGCGSEATPTDGFSYCRDMRSKFATFLIVIFGGMLYAAAEGNAYAANPDYMSGEFYLVKEIVRKNEYYEIYVEDKNGKNYKIVSYCPENEDDPSNTAPKIKIGERAYLALRDMNQELYGEEIMPSCLLGAVTLNGTTIRLDHENGIYSLSVCWNLKGIHYNLINPADTFNAWEWLHL